MATDRKTGPELTDGTAAEPTQPTTGDKPKLPKKTGGLPPNIANQFASKAPKHGGQMKNTGRNFRHQGR